MVKLSGQTPEQVLDDAVKLAEQTLLGHIPPQWGSAYMARVLQFAMVTTPPPVPERPRQVERYDAYVPFTEYDGL